MSEMTPLEVKDAVIRAATEKREQLETTIAALRQQVEALTAENAAEREAVRVLANEVRWHRRCDAENDTYSDDYSGGMRSAYEDSNANPIAAAAVRNKESE